MPTPPPLARRVRLLGPVARPAGRAGDAGGARKTLITLASSLERERYCRPLAARSRHALAGRPDCRMPRANRPRGPHDIGKIARRPILLKEGSDGRGGSRCGAIGDGRRPHRGIPSLRPERELVLAHHERFDGRLSASLAGRRSPRRPVFAVADSLDAMTTDRPYHSAASFRRRCRRSWPAGGRNSIRLWWTLSCGCRSRRGRKRRPVRECASGADRTDK